LTARDRLGEARTGITDIFHLYVTAFASTSNTYVDVPFYVFVY